MELIREINLKASIANIKVGETLTIEVDKLGRSPLTVRQYAYNAQKESGFLFATSFGIDEGGKKVVHITNLGNKRQRKVALS